MNQPQPSPQPVVRRTFTVAVTILGTVHSVSNADPEVIARIADQWQRASPQRKVHIFVNEFYD